MHEVFNVSKFSSYFILYLAKFLCGLKSEFTLEDISKHNCLEHDCSLFHNDYNNKNPNNHIKLSVEACENFKELISKTDDKIITNELIDEHFQNQLEMSKKSNPHYKFGWFQNLVSKTERSLLYDILLKTHTIDEFDSMIIKERLFQTMN